jgi:hypothetical protein
MVIMWFGSSVSVPPWGFLIGTRTNTKPITRIKVPAPQHPNNRSDRNHDAMSSPYDTGRFARVNGINDATGHTDVARIVAQMLADLDANPTAWENHDLGRFLDALTRSLRALPRLYANRGDQFPTSPTWRTFAEALVMATGYE